METEDSMILCKVQLDPGAWRLEDLEIVYGVGNLR